MEWTRQDLTLKVTETGATGVVNFPRKWDFDEKFKHSPIRKVTWREGLSRYRLLWESWKRKILPEKLAIPPKASMPIAGGQNGNRGLFSPICPNTEAKAALPSYEKIPIRSGRISLAIRRTCWSKEETGRNTIPRESYDLFLILKRFDLLWIWFI